MRFKPSKIKWVLVILGSSVFVVIGIWLIGREPMAGWIGTLFFGACLAAGIVNLLPNASYLELDEDAFTFCSLFRKSSVRWTDVDEFIPISIRSFDYVGWNYVTGYSSNEKLRKLSTSMSGVEAALPDTYGMTGTELCTLMHDWREKHIN